MKKLLLIIILSSLSVSCLGMKTPKEITPLQGELFLIPTAPMYAGSGLDANIKPKNVEKALGVKLDPNEPLFDVKVKNIDNEKTIEFPNSLPYYLIKDLKEGGQLFLTVYGQPIILTAKQKGCNYNQYTNGLFEIIRDYYFQDFKNDPNYFYCDKEDLLQKGIIATSSDKIIHGPNGYKFEEFSKFTWLSNKFTLKNTLTFGLLGALTYYSLTNYGQSISSWVQTIWPFKK
ncbi:MAG: hypothetical protein WDZ41_00745 [Candidatus Babeliales bacterium]